MVGVNSKNYKRGRRYKWVDTNDGEVDKMTQSTQKGSQDVPELPDMLTLAKIFMLASKRSYQPVILFALLINELGIIPSLLSVM